jgi:hypothetical protein
VQVEEIFVIPSSHSTSYRHHPLLAVLQVARVGEARSAMVLGRGDLRQPCMILQLGRRQSMKQLHGAAPSNTIAHQPPHTVPYIGLQLPHHLQKLHELPAASCPPVAMQ